MDRRTQSPKSLTKSLQRQQRKHRTLLTEVEKTTEQLDHYKHKIQATEAQIAELEQRLAEPRKKNAGKQAASDGELTHARLIFNPGAGASSKDNAARLAHIVSSLRVHGIQAHVGMKTSGKAARNMARDAVRSRHALVLVAGGDGTIEDVASQLVGTSTVLGIVPIGTMNNLARSLGVPLDIDGACALIGMGTTRHIDVGRVFSPDSPEFRYFLEGAGFGLSAIAMLIGGAVEKRRWHILPSALRKLFASKLNSIQVQLDDTTLAVSSRIVTVSNAPLLARNMVVAPGAKMDDGLLDIAVYDGMGDAELVKHFMAAASGSTDDLTMYRARRVRITAEQGEMGNADKQVTPQRCTIEMDIVPQGLAVIVGQGIGLTLPVASAPAAPPLTGNPPEEQAAVDEDLAKPEAVKA